MDLYLVWTPTVADKMKQFLLYILHENQNLRLKFVNASMQININMSLKILRFYYANVLES